MTKPQFAPEPSMEDILASIRKMISEERMGPRPVPDQIARTSIGERQQARAPERGPAETVSPETPAGRTTPSFSSLSDALKSAGPESDPGSAAQAERHALDEKIADMLDKSPAPAAGSAPEPRAPLAVFAANRPSTVSPARPTPPAGGTVPSRSVTREPLRAERADTTQPPRNDPSREALGSLSHPRGTAAGSPAPRRESPSFDTGAVGPPRSDPSREALGSMSRPRETPGGAPAPRSERPLGQREEPRAKPAAASPQRPKVARPASDEPKAETETIITLPARFPTAPNADDANAGREEDPMNGAGTRGSVLGLRPLPEGAKSTQPASDADAEETSPEAPAKEEASTTGFLAEEFNKGPTLAQEKATASAKQESPSEPAAAAAPASPSPASLFASLPKAEEGKSLLGAKPSEALVDAVVNLVQAEPSSLSVFTSGADFIRGVGSQDTGSVKPSPGAAGTLDRSATELLRPMLRQWLADNMPRIVEEALRSELMGPQPPEED